MENNKNKESIAKSLQQIAEQLSKDIKEVEEKEEEDGEGRTITPLRYSFNDGGRSVSGMQGKVGDCVVRAIAIATEKDYLEVYRELFKAGEEYRDNNRDKVAKALKRKGCSPRNGVYREVYDGYLKSLGWAWVPTMRIGEGCTVHLRKEELPDEVIIVRLSKHIATIRYGTLHDTYDCTREGSRCVYGYYIKKEKM